MSATCCSCGAAYMISHIALCNSSRLLNGRLCHASATTQGGPSKIEASAEVECLPWLKLFSFCTDESSKSTPLSILSF